MRSVRLLKQYLDKHKIYSKKGNPISRGALYTILKNPIYIGKINHHGKLYEGLHSGIIEQTFWDKVQKQLTINTQAKHLRTNAKAPSLLAGLLIDTEVNPFSSSHTKKVSKRYRYYVNQTNLQFKEIPPNTPNRVPAQTIETLVEKEIINLLNSPDKIISEMWPLNLSATHQEFVLKKADDIA